MKKGKSFSFDFGKFKDRKSRMSLTLVFSIAVFAIIAIALICAIIVLSLFVKLGYMTDVNGDINLMSLVLLMAGISVVMGFVIAFFSSKIPLRPVNDFINKINRLADGDFSVRLELGPTLSTYPAFVEMSTSFNKLAEELENTEMLRSDFINNFSHEFKTPIVSIAGFAKLLTKGNVLEEQRMEYYKLIEQESIRLSNMATNVLNLTKVENQSILTQVTKFNVSEQIRSVVLMFEDKWEEKQIELNIDLEEYDIYANEELLKEVWINLIDNAIKFSSQNALLTVEIAAKPYHYEISITNEGVEIPADKIKLIFNKFYQADESHATVGNGIGLAIVNKVVKLHNGEVRVESENGITTFTVSLPKEQ